MRAWSVLRQLLAATLCAVLALPACSSAASLSSSTPSHIYYAETLSETRVWGSNEKILLHFRAVLLLSEKQHWGYEKCRWENMVGSVVTYDYDAFGNLTHSFYLADSARILRSINPRIRGPQSTFTMGRTSSRRIAPGAP